MAHFYGTVQGGKGEASRLGHGDLRVTAQSFEGDIVVWVARSNEGDIVTLSVRDHGRGGSGTVLYHGLIKDLLNMEKRVAMMHALGIQKFMEAM